MKNLVKKIANILNLKELGKRALTVIILTLTAIITVWVYAAFVEPLAGPNDSDQDFLQNILGADNNNNDFSSSNVAANATGSIIERQQYQQTQIGTYADATTTPAAAASVFAALKDLDSKYQYQEYTSGSGNWTCPDNVYEVSALLVSGGGGSGAADGTTGGVIRASGGGGGGAVGFFTKILVFPGTAYAYSVGAGGAAGAVPSGSGGTGGSTSFHVMTLAGGSGSVGATNTGGVRFGGPGGAGAACKTASGGAAGAQGDSATNGSNGVDNTYGESAIGLQSGAGGGGVNSSAGDGKIGGSTIYASGGTGGYTGGGGGASYGAGGNGKWKTTGGEAAANTGGGAGGIGTNNDADSPGFAGGSGYILLLWKKQRMPRFAEIEDKRTRFVAAESRPQVGFCQITAGSLFFEKNY